MCEFQEETPLTFTEIIAFLDGLISENVDNPHFYSKMSVAEGQFNATKIFSPTEAICDFHFFGT